MHETSTATETGATDTGMTAPGISAAAVEHYVTVVLRRLTILLAGRAPASVIDDVVQSELLRLIEHLGEIMAKYPEPVAYAAARGTGGRALIDHVRRDNVQRGRGAKGRRSVLGGDTAHVRLGIGGYHLPGTGSNYEAAARESDLELHSATADNPSLDLLRASLAQLPDDQRTLIVLVDCHGYSVTHAAALLGVRRETAARKHSAAVSALRSLAAAAAAEGSSAT